MNINRRHIRSAWLWVGSLVTVAMLVFGSLNVVALLARERSDIRTVIDDHRVQVIDVRTNEGTVRINGTTASSTVVTAHITRGIRKTEQRIDVVDDRLVIRGGCSGFLSSQCRVDYDIDVPAGLDVVIHHANEGTHLTALDGNIDVSGKHGDIRIDHASGPIRVRTQHGDLTARDLHTTTLDLSTQHGDIRIEFTIAPTSIKARTQHGDVKIIVPDSPDTYRTELSTGHGDTKAAIRTDPKADRVIDVGTSHGDVRIEYPQP